MSRIGILGGTFNPIHNGHIQMAKYSHDAAKLDKVILMPTFVPPHKESANLVSCEHRFNMCRLASAELPYAEVSDFEIKLEGKSYTYRTLQLLKSQNENDDFYFIVGADMFLSMQNWKNPEIIFRLYYFHILPTAPLAFPYQCPLIENCCIPFYKLLVFFIFTGWLQECHSCFHFPHYLHHLSMNYHLFQFDINFGL